MEKIFVLDTNILLHDPQSIYKFDEHTVIIPLVVIEEIDKFKRDLNEIGRNARQISRNLDAMRKTGKLSKGVRTPGGGLIRVELEAKNLSRVPNILKNETADNRILTIALYLKEKYEEGNIIFISKDINLRIKADALGITSEDYEASKVEIDELYSGTAVRKFDPDVINRIHETNQVEYVNNDLYPNQFILMQDNLNPSHTAIARFVKSSKMLVKIKNRKEGVWGITARNVEQTFALEALTNKDLQLITLVGKAGTGKTLLAMAAGLFGTVEQGIYSKLLVSRPIFPLGKDIGYLPGNMEDKLKPWMQPIFDNMDLLTSLSGGTQNQSGVKKGKNTKGYHEYIEQGVVEIEPLTYIRGRSIPNQFMIIDEAQNLTQHEIKTIITRAGTNTKLVITGDPYQIDNPYVDSSSNGLSYVVEKLKAEEITGHVTLMKGERSYLAETAANLL